MADECRVHVRDAIPSGKASRHRRGCTASACASPGRAVGVTGSASSTPGRFTEVGPVADRRPCDQDAGFEAKIVAKRQRQLSGARGLSQTHDLHSRETCPAGCPANSPADVADPDGGPIHAERVSAGMKIVTRCGCAIGSGACSAQRLNLVIAGDVGIAIEWIGVCCPHPSQGRSSDSHDRSDSKGQFLQRDPRSG